MRDLLGAPPHNAFLRHRLRRSPSRFSRATTAEVDGAMSAEADETAGAAAFREASVAGRDAEAGDSPGEPVVEARAQRSCFVIRRRWGSAECFAVVVHVMSLCRCVCVICVCVCVCACTIAFICACA